MITKNNYRTIIPVPIAVFISCDVSSQVYVLKRPYVDEFLKKMGEMFECVLFTASLAKVSIASQCMIACKLGTGF